MKNVKVITIESDFGAGTKGAKLGPQAMLKHLPHQIFPNSEIIQVNNPVEYIVKNISS